MAQCKIISWVKRFFKKNEPHKPVSIITGDMIKSGAYRGAARYNMANQSECSTTVESSRRLNLTKAPPTRQIIEAYTTPANVNPMVSTNLISLLRDTNTQKNEFIGESIPAVGVRVTEVDNS